MRSRLIGWSVAGFFGLLLAPVACLHFQQHKFIYDPRPYDQTYARALPAGASEIRYRTSFGAQTAYYIPGAPRLPKRLWVAFCGNASLALDWVTILRGYPKNDDAFLLVDYPGYGRNEGYATIESTRVTANAALAAALERLQVDEKDIAICGIGHSLGAAAVLDFAAHHAARRLVLIAPFTTLRDEAATVVGRFLALLVVENYDNRANLARIHQRDPGTKVAIFHGTADEVIPCRFGRALAAKFSWIDFFPVERADHVTVLEDAREKMMAWMNQF